MTTRTERPLDRIPHRLRHVGLVLCLCVSTGCASGGGGSAGGGTGIGTVAITGSGAGRVSGGALLELTSEPSVTETTMPATVGAVWSVLPSVFETLEIETSVVEPGSFRFGNLRFVARRIAGNRMSRFVDCGDGFDGPRANRQRVTLGVLVRLVAAEDGGTLVTTVVDGYAEPRGVSGNPVRCRSTHVLEGWIEELIAGGLAARSRR